jgi:hypothetical protein
MSLHQPVRGLAMTGKSQTGFRHDNSRGFSEKSASDSESTFGVTSLPIQPLQKRTNLAFVNAENCDVRRRSIRWFV